MKLLFTIQKLDELYENNKEFLYQILALLIPRIRVKDGDTLSLLIKTTFESGVMVLKAGTKIH